MPLTFAHAAAVLPLRPLTPRWLSLPALIAGSMSPDAFYFVGLTSLAGQAHTMVKGTALSLVAGTLLLAGFYRWRRPVARLLPEPYRSACSTAQASGAPFSVVSSGVSLCIGLWTHLLWDNFTHPWGWFVRNLEILRAPWLTLGPVTVDGFKVIQYASSLVGVLILAMAIQRWTARIAPGVDFQLHGVRRKAWVRIAAASLIAGMANALYAPSYAGLAMYFTTASSLVFLVLTVTTATWLTHPDDGASLR